jgi:uncharacterized membrane protein YqjE
MQGDTKNGRSLAQILSDMKSELTEFAQTRIELLKREMKEKAAALKSALPLLVAGALFLTTGFLLFSVALAALVATAFADNPYRWFFGSLAVAILWSICGAGVLYGAKRRLNMQSMVPQRTIEVLSGDKTWIQKEARKVS